MNGCYRVTDMGRFVFISTFILLLSLLYSPSLKGQKNEEVRTIVQVGHTSPVIQYDISNDGRYLASVEMTRKVIVWDIKRGKQLIDGLKPKDVQQRFSKIKFNPRNSGQLYGAVGTINPVQHESQLFGIYNWRTGAKTGIITRNEFKDPLHRFENILYETRRDCSLEAIDAKTQERLMQYKGSVVPLGNASVHRSDSLLFVMENNPQLWDLAKMEMVCRLPYKQQLLKDTSIVYINDRVSPVKKNMHNISKYIENPSANAEYRKYGNRVFIDGFFFGDTIVIGGYGQYITVWDINGNLLSSVPVDAHPVFSLDMQDNKILAATEMGLCYGDINAARLEIIPSTKGETMTCVKYIPGTGLFAAGTDIGLFGNIYIGNAVDPSQIKRQDKPDNIFISLTYDESGRHILAVGELGAIFQYNLHQETWFRYNDPFLRARVSSCAFLPGNKLAAGSNEGIIALWHRYEKEPYRLVKAHNGEITSINTSHDKRFIFTTSNDGTTKIWNSDFEEILKLIALEDTEEYIAITPDHYYKASQNCSKAVHFTKGSEIYEYDQFDLKYNRPDIVLQRLGVVSDQIVGLYHNAWKKRLKKMNFSEDMLSDDFHTPVLEIVSAGQIPVKTTDPNISFEVSASDSKYPLNRLLVWLNGVPVYGLQGIALQSSPGQEIIKSLNIELTTGVNRIDVSCMNDKGAEAYKQTIEVVYEAETPLPDLYLVSIGVSEYQDSSFNLNYADKDAKDVLSLFQEINNEKTYRKIHSKVLTNGEVTRNSVQQMREFIKQAGRNDVVVLFYAGHGMFDDNLDYFLAMSDMNFDNPAERGIMYEDFEMLLNGINPLKKLIIIDACHSGEIDKEEYLAENTTPVEQGDVVFRSVGKGVRQVQAVSVAEVNDLLNSLFSDIRRGVGATILSSAGGSEAAVESDKWQNGLFTFVLKEGLLQKKADSDGNGAITTAELHLYTQQRVVELSGGRQQPTSRINNKQYEFTIIN